MFLKLAYCAFSSSSLKDATMRTFWGFSSFLLKFKPFDEFFPFQKVIANLSLWVVSTPRNRVTGNGEKRNIACVAAAPRTRLNHLYSPSAN